MRPTKDMKNTSDKKITIDESKRATRKSDAQTQDRKMNRDFESQKNK